MIGVCNFCNKDIVGREPAARFCFSCVDGRSKRTGATNAHNAVQKAVKKGILVPAKTLVCIDCGEMADRYDHRDYNKPLDVVPVCRKCNAQRGKATPVLSQTIKLSMELITEQITEQQQAALHNAIAKAGSKAKLARLLGVSRAAVTHWKKLPNGRLYQLQVMQPEWFK
jgi:NAD-dependent SIR2 family protein deacetylase